MNKPVFQERISQKIYFFEFDLGRCDTRLFGLLKVKKKKVKKNSNLNSIYRFEVNKSIVIINVNC